MQQFPVKCPHSSPCECIDPLYIDESYRGVAYLSPSEVLCQQPAQQGGEGAMCILTLPDGRIGSDTTQGHACTVQWVDRPGGDCDSDGWRWTVQVVGSDVYALHVPDLGTCLHVHMYNRETRGWIPMGDGEGDEADRVELDTDIDLGLCFSIGDRVYGISLDPCCHSDAIIWSYHPETRVLETSPFTASDTHPEWSSLASVVAVSSTTAYLEQEGEMYSYTPSDSGIVGGHWRSEGAIPGGITEDNIIPLGPYLLCLPTWYSVVGVYDTVSGEWVLDTKGITTMVGERERDGVEYANPCALYSSGMPMTLGDTDTPLVLIGDSGYAQVMVVDTLTPLGGGGSRYDLT
ncbi:hypothetical protein KIPB_001716 [Kipferlia bialata]|uniref:Uncharacterized protein n=1 Tax=Kipferlia bialata TaxID=797122 RepID=A0A391NIX6_9EUKA|nr:hypothetical protein KIPB_001246 [Kipferlia bialata]GCA62171.1 hypothetical protein KIPB_001716 [Kipferlia bialata]|eukprot:g1246.t1